MQSLLNDIELDVQELKCVLQALPSDAAGTLRAVARRNIAQLRHRLDALACLLEEEKPAAPHGEAPAASVPCGEPASPCVERADAEESCCAEIPAAAEERAAQVVQPQAAILGDRIRPGVDLSHALSLNDSFRFARELFDGDMAALNGLLRRLGGASSLDEAVDMVHDSVHEGGEEQKAVMADFEELLKKYFA